MAPKVIIAAPKAVSEFLAEEYVNWEIQNCATIAELWQGLETGELSDEAEMVFIADNLFDETPEPFVDAVASLASVALVIVIAYKNEDELIRWRVKKCVEDNNLPEASFHFVRADIALLEIEKILAQHDQDHALPIYHLTQIPL